MRSLRGRADPVRGPRTCGACGDVQSLRGRAEPEGTWDVRSLSLRNRKVSWSIDHLDYVVQMVYNLWLELGIKRDSLA